MSYASVLAKNAPPEERQVHPDPNLLTRPEDIESTRPISPGAPADDLVADKVHIVDRDEIEKLREAVAHADEPTSTTDDHFAEAQQHQAERDQARLKAQAQAELKRTTDKVEAVGKEAEEKGKELYDEAKSKGKKLEKEAEDTFQQGKKEVGKAWEQGKKDAKEFAGKVEREGKKDAEKLKRKASEVEREGRALAKKYPNAATGLVGLTNALLIAIPTYFAVKHWHQPRWDRRVVSLVTVGLGSIFAAEGALGWFEYDKEPGRR
ncbi:proteophosphoglycan ppg1 [Rhodotorula toruloides]|uniref:Proteophosphoglycan ppg1 n=1 Tax=Rhodotorula toruloides TaxID=5286 RepID=A0A511KGU8_RHOTO|nr:proteophosphoglycan ppg1 [Rhodotorula toruloides]